MTETTMHQATGQGDREGPHPASAQPPPLQWLRWEGRPFIVGAGEDEGVGGDPCGRPLAFSMTSPPLMNFNNRIGKFQTTGHHQFRDACRATEEAHSFGRQSSLGHLCYRNGSVVIPAICSWLKVGMGSEKMMRAPPCGAFSARTVPPCASMMPRTMARPRPLPPVEIWRELSAR